MKYYDYEEAMKEDIREYINDNFTTEQLKERDRDELQSDLEEELFVSDSVTGNASGSYTFNSYTAKEYVCDNLDLVREAYEDFGSLDELGRAFVNEAWEGMDVTIRCYLLWRVLDEVLDEVYDNLYCNEHDC